MIRDFDVVTGAFGFTGRYITRRLLDAGRRVRTLTGHPRRERPFGDQVSARPYAFDDPDALARSLDGADTLYNTYWIRFARGELTFDRAVANTAALATAAGRAGVRRIVHISVANPSAWSPLPYYRGKAQAEQAVMASGVPYAILRPTLLFGDGAILLNNIAWMLRRLPVFFAPEGDYRVQPVSVEDLADLAVEAAQGSGNTVFDAAGPETLLFPGLLRLLARAVDSLVLVLAARPPLCLFLSQAIGLALRDVVLTRDEMAGLTAGLLRSHEPPRGTTRLSDWLQEHGEHLGERYVSDLDRHYRQGIHLEDVLKINPKDVLDSFIIRRRMRAYR